MIIIFDGGDRVGKDTQIKLLQKHFYPNKMFHVLHYSGFSDKSLKRQEEMEISKSFNEEMFEVLNVLRDKNLILNRSYIGEYVYGPLYRKYDIKWLWKLEDEQIKNLNDQTYLIVLVDDADNLISRDDGNSFSVDPDLKDLEVKRFIDAYHISSLKNKILINIKNMDSEAVHEEILKFLGV